MTSGGESDGGYIYYKKWLHIGGCFVPFYNTYKALAGWCRFNTPCHFFHDSPCLIGKESKYIWGCRFWCWIGIQKSKDTYIPYLGYLLNMTLRQTWIVIVLLAYLYIFIFPKKNKYKIKRAWHSFIHVILNNTVSIKSAHGPLVYSHESSIGNNFQCQL